MKNFTLNTLFLFLFLFPFQLDAQISFGDTEQTLQLPFEVSGIEFINDDIWVVNEDRLIKLSFPELEIISEYLIPIGVFPISDITSDGENRIWLGEGTGGPNGFLHLFDMTTEEFVYSNELIAISDYQIQGIEYYDGELWISNFLNQSGFSNILKFSEYGVFTGELLSLLRMDTYIMQPMILWSVLILIQWKLLIGLLDKKVLFQEYVMFMIISFGFIELRFQED